VEQPVPDPVFVNVEYIFYQVFNKIKGILAFIFSIRLLILIKVLVVIIIILLLTAIIYCLIRLWEIKKEGEKKKDASPIAQTADNAADGVPVPSQRRNEIWESIRAKILSDSPSDWRLAIIEADIYLDKALDQNGYYGTTTSDKLKQATEKLPSVQLAWEAHKVRNRIAHEGAAYTLTMPEARRVLSYFEITFRDLGVID